MSSNSIKIFITTDSHLGYKEKDETLSNDAFVNLENAFQLAEHFDCDLLLHSGDLFHTATPSHWSVNKALKLFSQYCLGSKQLEIKNPVILKKKDQYVCLYGLGYIHDEKVNKLFLHRNIHFEPPPKDLERKVFCILLLHQNRYRIKSAVKPEQCFENQNIPDFINFVVWGHEHECELSEVKLNSQTRILQPGSSVITSLKLHESMPKNHFILELKQNRYRLHRLPISTARIFIYDEIESDNVVESDTVHEKIQILLLSQTVTHK
ncbi:double-strand break repair protein MRE11-like [Dermatophagoides farinae]|uniref:double-strand break repair protein MRE11-like n=1 Tax=Dermatophagoides farinae TaxID=6954 RepID=UPI003F6179C5